MSLAPFSHRCRCCSVAGVLPLQLQAAYSAAKSGLINLTQSMGLELGKQGILCNAIAPGTIATAGTAGLWVRPNSPPLPRRHPFARRGLMQRRWLRRVR